MAVTRVLGAGICGDREEAVARDREVERLAGELQGALAKVVAANGLFHARADTAQDLIRAQRDRRLRATDATCEDTREGAAGRTTFGGRAAFRRALRQAQDNNFRVLRLVFSLDN